MVRLINGIWLVRGVVKFGVFLAIKSPATSIFLTHCFHLHIAFFPSSVCSTPMTVDEPCRRPRDPANHPLRLFDIARQNNRYPPPTPSPFCSHISLTTVHQATVHRRADGPLLEAALPPTLPRLRRRPNLNTDDPRQRIHPPSSRALLRLLNQLARHPRHSAIRRQRPDHPVPCRGDGRPLRRRRGPQLRVSPDVGLSGGHWRGTHELAAAGGGDGACGQGTGRQCRVCECQD